MTECWLQKATCANLLRRPMVSVRAVGQSRIQCDDGIFSYQVCMLALKICKIQCRNCEILLSSACVNDTGLNIVTRKQLLLDL